MIVGLRRCAGLAAVILALCACTRQPARYSGTVQTESVAVGSQIGGRIEQVSIAVGSRVHRGSVLLRLDPAILRAQYDQARAQSRHALEQLAELEHGNVATDVARAREQTALAEVQYQQAVAQSGPLSSAQAATVRDAAAAVREAQASVSLTSVTLARTARLVATGDVARQSLDQARSNDREARARLAQARARLAQARSNYANVTEAQLPAQEQAARANLRAATANYQTVRNGSRPEEIDQARAAYAAAQAGADYARVRLEEAIVRAPADGIVESFNLHPGDLLSPNQQAAIIDEFADPYTYIYASQSDLGALVRGASLRVVSDAGGAEYDGIVEAHDRSAQFTPQNVETADQRAQLVYGVKVRIHDPQHRLLAGTTVTVYPR